MSLDHTDGPILQKTRDLCQTILDQPEFASIQHRMAAFLTNDEARARFESVNAKGLDLQQKQQRGQSLTPAEISDFERERDDLLRHPLIQGFFEAQQEMQQVRDLISRHVARTFELGRLPGPEDFSSCGAGCRCG